MTDEEYVRSKWIRAEPCPSNRPEKDPTWCISLGGRYFTRATPPEPSAATEAEAWQAARAFTEEREEEIRLIQREINCCGDETNHFQISTWMLFGSAMGEGQMVAWAVVRAQRRARTLRRLEAVRDNLMKGMELRADS